MTIEQLDKKSVLISLKNEDMKLYSLSIEGLNLKEKQCSEALKKILDTALNTAGISNQDKAVLIEAYPHKDGCLILLTVDDKIKLRKTYKVKRLSSSLCCRFTDAENLLSCMEQLSKHKTILPGNTLWVKNNIYYLFFDFPFIPPKAQAILTEYAKFHTITNIEKASICERGHLLTARNAASEIGKTFQKQN